ncbi:MAG TPA: ribosome silencing factor [Deltaproteobacteria bacterium]|nr:ribosome silencing factor [Deltaproteobacteria bacterium]
MDETDPGRKATRIVEAALERKAERPVVMDMRKLTAYADTFIILSGRSDRQVRSIADAVVRTLKENDEQPLGIEGLDDGNWVLIDCNDAIVHVFDDDTRERYDLERLWRDAPRLDLGIEGVDPDPAVQAPFEREATEPVGDVGDEGSMEDEAADPAA